MESPWARRLAGAVGVGALVASAPVLAGFGAGGVLAGSAAAAIQSSVYGAAVPAGSWFAIAQSAGGVHLVKGVVAGVATAVAQTFWGNRGAVEDNVPSDTEAEVEAEMTGASMNSSGDSAWDGTTSSSSSTVQLRH